MFSVCAWNSLLFMGCSLASHYAEHRRVPGFQYLAVAQEHVDTAGQTGIKAAHGPHNVNALEVLGPVLFENGRVLHRVFVGTGSAVNVARVGVPARRRIRMVIGDLAV